MRLPLSWLAEQVDPGLDTAALSDLLTLSGTLVEAVHRIGPEDTPGNRETLLVGRVLAAEQHPNADRLRVCSVDVGEEEPRQIVCGAPNVAAGQNVPVALPGARLPGSDRPLKAAKLRGVASQGMICSAAELNLAADAAGIMVLSDDLAAGTPIATALGGETVLELEITSNRPDCLAIAGLAREVHAASGAPLTPLDESEPPATGAGAVAELANVTVADPDLCPRYMARVFTDVTVGPSPGWLVARLEAAGMRSISNVVDITNYVMLLTGQPLHAFDLDRIAGGEIVVRRATAGERVTTLDGVERSLGEGTLTIADREGPLAIAGIFGAAAPEVGTGTERVLLEAATFDGPAVLQTSLDLGLRTESSGRFEKGLPRQLPPRALAIASRLLVDLCGARWVPGTIDRYEPAVDPAPIELRIARIPAVLGIAIAQEDAAAILTRLGCAVSAGDGLLTVTPPFERAADLTREIDLIEEVGRIHGFDRVPSELPRLVGRGVLTPAQTLERRLTRLLADRGLSEAITHHQVPANDADLLGLAADDPRREVIRMARPMSAEMAVLRRSMLPGLLRAVARNQAHQRSDGGLFEVGRTYAPRADGLADERRWLATVQFGETAPAGWRSPSRPADLFVATGLATTLARAAGVALETRPNAAPYFHPVRQAKLVAAGDPETVIAWAAEVHPRVLRAFDVEGTVAAVVLDLDALGRAARHEPPRFEDLLSVPVSTRDLAVVVAEDVPAGELVAAAQAAGAPLVRSVAIFDRYAGDQVGQGRVSLALRLTLVDPGRTLTDQEIDGAVAAVQAALEQRGARLRA